MKRNFASATAILILAACSSPPPQTHVAAAGNGGGEQGYYKVGKPYQINGVTYIPAFDPNYDETGIASWYAGEFTGEHTANGELYDPNQLTAAHRTLPLPSLVRVTNLENGRALIVRINDRGPFSQARIIDLSRRCAQLLGFEQKGTAKVRLQILAKESEALADAARHGELATQVATAIETNPVPAQAVAAGPTPTPEPNPAPQTAPVQTAMASSSQIVATPLADTSGGEKVVDERAVMQQETGAATPKGQSVGGRFLPAPVVQTEKVSKTNIFVQAGAFSSVDNANKLRDRLSALHAAVETVLINGKQMFRVRVGPLKSVVVADGELTKVIQSGVPDAKIVVE